MARSRVVSARLRSTCIVTTKAGDSFRGVLFDADDRAIVLRNAEHIAARGDRGPVVVDGEVLILVGEVQYVQIVGPSWSGSEAK